jgi:hypothetical protein
MMDRSCHFRVKDNRRCRVDLPIPFSSFWAAWRLLLLPSAFVLTLSSDFCTVGAPLNADRAISDETFSKGDVW